LPSGASLRAELVAALGDAEHWLEGAIVEGADLSGIQACGAKLPYASFQDSNLSGATLAEAVLDSAVLRSADLTGAVLARASLCEANLVGANLSGAHLEHSKMHGANCEGAIADDLYLFGAQLSAETTLLGVDVSRVGELRDHNYARAAQVYRTLDVHFRGQADYRHSDECYYRAMRATHALEGGSTCRATARLYWMLHSCVWGYGIRPRRVLAWAAAVILCFGIVVYPVLGIGGPVNTSHDIGQGLALSLVTFATLGYGNRIPVSVLGECVAGLEALSGAVLVSMFLVALATKYVRRG
jgi:uncharacterized protein YjbI with pentapeptide repeats